MTTLITDADWDHLQNVPERDIVEMAIDLDILVPEVVDHRGMLEHCVRAILERADQEGLPFSKYDRDDLEALPAPYLQALGRLQGIRGAITVDTVLKTGQKVYRLYTKQRPNNPTALLIPSLLHPIARGALARGSS